MSALLARLAELFRRRTSRGRAADRPAAEVTSGSQTAGIEVTTAFDPPWFAKRWSIRPRLEIDGAAAARWQWGTCVLPVAAGVHRLRCWIPVWYLFKTFERGAADVEVEVPEGGLVRLSYTARPGFAFRPGHWVQGATVGFAAGGPGWHPDPSGRPVLRYWDGTAWTSHVAGGQQPSE